jgi:SRSO17 transposase
VIKRYGLSRRPRKNAVASCAIEGLYLPPEALEEVRKVSQMYATSDEMVAHLIKSMEASDE